MVRQNRPASTIPIPCRLRCQTPLSYVFRSPCLKINILRLNAPKNAVANESFRGVYMQKILPIVYLNESKMPGIVYFPGLSPFAPHPKIKKSKTPEIQIGYRTADDRTQKRKEKVVVRVIGSSGHSGSRDLAGTWERA